MANSVVSELAFQPHASGTVSLAVTAASDRVQVTGASDETHVYVFNEGSVTSFVNWGTSNSVTASATADFPVPAGGVEIIAISAAQFPWFAAITASGSTKVFFCAGKGR